MTPQVTREMFPRGGSPFAFHVRPSIEKSDASPAARLRERDCTRVCVGAEKRVGLYGDHHRCANRLRRRSHPPRYNRDVCYIVLRNTLPLPSAVDQSRETVMYSYRCDSYRGGGGSGGRRGGRSSRGRNFHFCRSIFNRGVYSGRCIRRFHV